MNDDTLSLIFGIILLLIMCGTPLMYSEEREIVRLQNNFVAHLSNSNWDRATRMLADDFAWNPYDPKSEQELVLRGDQAWDAWRVLIADEEDRAAVDYDIVSVRKINQQKYVIALKMQIRKYNANRNSNIFWNATMEWIEVGNRWQLVRIKDTNEREEVFAY